MENKIVANKIKELRKRKGFSQGELSENSGLSLRTIQRLENGETKPRGDTLKRLAASFGISSDKITDWQIVVADFGSTGCVREQELPAIYYTTILPMIFLWK